MGRRGADKCSGIHLLEGLRGASKCLARISVYSSKLVSFYLFIHSTTFSIHTRYGILKFTLFSLMAPLAIASGFPFLYFLLFHLNHSLKTTICKIIWIVHWKFSCFQWKLHRQAGEQREGWFRRELDKMADFPRWVSLWRSQSFALVFFWFW
jgi:hypothetical protein